MTHARTHARTDACTYARTHARTHGRTHGRTHIHAHCIVNIYGSQSQVQTVKSRMRAARAWWKELLLLIQLVRYVPSASCITASPTQELEQAMLLVGPVCNDMSDSGGRQPPHRRKSWNRPHSWWDRSAMICLVLAADNLLPDARVGTGRALGLDLRQTAW